MSILIKGMEMPKSCEVCWFDDGVHCMAYPPSEDMVYDIADGIPYWCPLVPVPPHGRLIDVDVVQKRMEEYGWKHPDSTIHEFLEDDIPTIIEAEEGE